MQQAKEIITYDTCRACLSHEPSLAGRVPSTSNYIMIEEEWECPVGLTKEHAICVDSSSDEEGDLNVVTSSNDNLCNNDEELRPTVGGDTTTSKASSISSFFKSGPSRVQEVAASGESCAQAMSDPISDANKSIPNTNLLLSDDTTNETNTPTLPQISGNTDNQKDDSNSNPFAAFAFKADETPATSSKSWQSKKRTLQLPTKTAVTARSQKKVKQLKQSPKQKESKKSWSMKELQSQSTKTEGDEQLDKEEHRQVLIKKWHSFSNPAAPIEERRFQVLIAARIHARCQEPIVHKAMQRLRDYFAAQEEPNNDGSAQSLSAQCLSQCDPETDIAPLLSSVLFGNAKAQHIVQAAQDVLSKFRGQVPESMTSLQDITGIGPKLSQILNIVNRRDTYTSLS